MNLGRQKWPDAVSHFLEASKAYGEAGNPQKQNEAHALATFFSALTRNDPDSWLTCNKAMESIGEAQVNIGFNANAADISRQSLVIHDDLIASAGITNASAVGDPNNLRHVAQEYMELSGSELVVWKMLGQEIDPSRRGNYFLGLASLSEANSMVNKDPRKAVSMLSQAVTHLDISESDPLGLKGWTKNLRDRASVTAKCWFCRREIQGKDIHFVTLPAEITEYMNEKYGKDTPTSLLDEGIVACQGCYSSVRILADKIAKSYYEQAIAELRATETRLNSRINSLEQEISRLESKIRQVAAAR